MARWNGPRQRYDGSQPPIEDAAEDGIDIDEAESIVSDARLEAPDGRAPAPAVAQTRAAGPALPLLDGESMLEKDADIRKYLDAFAIADKSINDVATAAGNTMPLLVIFGSTIPESHGEPRTLGIRVPCLATVAFLKRAIMRHPGFRRQLLPSVLRLTYPVTGEVLQPYEACGGQEAGAPPRGAACPAALAAAAVRRVERTLGSYGVHHGAELLLDIDEKAGDPREGSRRQLQPRGRPLAVRRTASPGATAARRQQQHDAAAAAAPARPPADPRAADGAAAAAGGDRSYNFWSLEETLALLRGMLRHGRGWEAIKGDLSFSAALAGRSGVNLKDKWRNLQEAAGQDPCPLSSDVQGMIKKVCRLTRVTAAGPEQQPQQRAAAAAAAAAPVRSAAGGAALTATPALQPAAAGAAAARPLGAAPAQARPPAAERGRGNNAWSLVETLALLHGMLRHGPQSSRRWKEIKEDPSFSAALAGRSGVNLKDRWRNLRGGRDPDVRDLVREVLKRDARAAA